MDENLKKPEYAFNYWVLSRLYSLDEETLSENITDINDKGIDCWVHYEDTKELYLIQNKFYSDGSIVSREDVADFLKTPLTVLLRGGYKRSPELQKIFDRAITDSEYKICLHFYVTNNYMSSDIKSLIDNFSFDNKKDKRIEACIYAKYLTLQDIRNTYFDDRFTEKKNFTAELSTRTTGTSLDIRPVDYDLKWMIDSRYVLVNVVELYRVYNDAQKSNYELFEENIREYLGTKGINNGIIKTLKDPNDRANFFYYNNGITIICEECKTRKVPAVDKDHQNRYGFSLVNPQIVNGCQTMNSIAEVLSHFSDDRLDIEFSKAFVLVKVFVFDSKTKKSHPDLDLNIVRFTNSQNAINDKAFASKHNYFLNIQMEFKKRGVLLLVKPSDSNKFRNEYTSPTLFNNLKSKSQNLFDFFDISTNNISSLEIQLEKLLKVLLAFLHDGFDAYKRGSNVLKQNSPVYKTFSLKIADSLSIDNMLRLFLMFLKAENDKKKSKDKRHPIPYYVLGFMGVFFKNKTPEDTNKILDMLFNDKAMFSDVYTFFSKLTSTYSKMVTETVDYNVMIKQEISTKKFKQSLDLLKGIEYPNNVKKFLED